MRKETLLLLPLSFMLSGCFAGAPDFFTPDQPEHWSSYEAISEEKAEIEQLSEWWKRFKSPQLDELIAIAMTDSPDRLAAEARILEARGIRKSSRAILFPQIGASGSAGREDTGASGSSSDSFYDAQFDASFELDIFGKNRNAFGAASSQLEAAEADYQDVSLTLIADIARNYIDYRTAQKQAFIADKNLAFQEKTLDLITELQRLGEAPNLDVERTKNLVSTTRASIPEFSRQAENALLRLSVLTGALPDKLRPILKKVEDVPGSDVNPVLLAPAKVLSLRPDVRAAAANLSARTDLAESATAEIFPTFNLGGFYGIADNSLVSSANVWSVAVGAAVSLLDFGRIAGRIDAARAREQQAFQLYRKTILSAVSEVETALNDYARTNERRASLFDAYESAQAALGHSQNLYQEGEISFLDVLDAQRSTLSAEAALVSAEGSQAESLVRLFKSLGVY